MKELYINIQYIVEYQSITLRKRSVVSYHGSLNSVALHKVRIQVLYVLCNFFSVILGKKLDTFRTIQGPTVEFFLKQDEKRITVGKRHRTWQSLISQSLFGRFFAHVHTYHVHSG